MKGARVKRKGDIYLAEFDSYDAMLVYLAYKKPSQVSICFDGEDLTASIPVAAYTVTPSNEAKE